MVHINNLRKKVKYLWRLFNKFNTTRQDVPYESFELRISLLLLHFGGTVYNSSKIWIPPQKWHTCCNPSQLLQNSEVTSRFRTSAKAKRHSGTNNVQNAMLHVYLNKTMKSKSWIQQAHINKTITVGLTQKIQANYLQTLTINGCPRISSSLLLYDSFIILSLWVENMKAPTYMFKLMQTVTLSLYYQ